jgi:hypothetical protein
MKRTPILALFLCILVDCISHGTPRAWYYTQPRSGEWLVQEVPYELLEKTPPSHANLKAGIFALNTNPNVAAWCDGCTTISIDLGNSTGCANDTNTCTQDTCGANGAGPCLTWEQIDYVRWGCYGDPMGCPPLKAASTTIHTLSPAPNFLSTFVFQPALITVPGGTSSPSVNILGIPSAGAGSTITYTHTLNRSGNQPWTTSGLTQGVLYQDTSNPAFTWQSGWSQGIVNFRNLQSQPLAPIVLTSNGTPPTNPAEVAALNGDSITPLTTPALNVASIRPMIKGQGGGIVTLGHVTIPENVVGGVGTGTDAVYIGRNVILYESWVQKQVDWHPHVNNTASDMIINCALEGGIQGGTGLGAHAQSPSDLPPAVIGGYLTNQSTIPGSATTGVGTTAVSGVMFDGDFALRQFGASDFDLSVYNWIGFMYAQTLVSATEGIVDMQTFNYYGGNILYGTSTIGAGNGIVIYPTGATGGATAFPGTHVTISRGTVGCVSLFANPALGSCNNALTTGSSLDALLGATKGMVYLPNMGGFTNGQIP